MEKSTIKFPRMHVSLYVSDLERTIGFYSALFGQEPSKRKAAYAKYELSEPGLIISFIENADRARPDFGHLGIQLGSKEEVMARLETARGQGIVSKEEIGTACCYALQDKFWANDPDGHQWEIYYFHKDVEFNDPRYEIQGDSTCCMPPVKEETAPMTLQLNTVKAPCCEPGSGCC